MESQVKPIPDLPSYQISGMTSLSLLTLETVPSKREMGTVDCWVGEGFMGRRVLTDRKL